MSMNEPADGQSPTETIAKQAAPPRSLKRRAFGNALWNWLGVGVDNIAGIILTPLLIRTLGDSVYGTWIVIGALAGYLGVLDLGLRSAVGRSVAFHLARNDRERLSSIVNTAVATLTSIGLLAFLCVMVLVQVFDSLTHIPAEQMQDAQLALSIVGVNLALWFPIQVLDGILYGYERFDRFNMVYTPTQIARAVLAGTVVTLGYGLVGLACATLVVTIGSGIAKLWMCRITDSALGFAPRDISRSALSEMWGFGFWNFLASLGNMARTQLSPVLIGAILGTSVVASFSVIRRILGTAAEIINAGIGALVPHATALHSLGDAERQRRLFIDTGKFCVAAALGFFTLFILLGDALLALWIRPEMAKVWGPLAIAACGELVPMAIMMSNNTIHGMARNRPLAFRGAAECLMVLGLAFAVGDRFGLAGICAAFAVAANVWRGVFTLAHALRLLELPLSRFIQESVAPMVLAIIPGIVALSTLVFVSPATTWPHLIAYGSLFSLISCLMAITVALGPAWMTSQAKSLFASRLSPTSEEA